MTAHFKFIVPTDDSILYHLNKEQYKFNDKIELYMNCTAFTVDFKYIPLYRTCRDIPVKLEEIGDIIANKLYGKKLDIAIVYYTAMSELAERLNPYDIGIVLNHEVEDIIKKRIDRVEKELHRG